MWRWKERQQLKPANPYATAPRKCNMYQVASPRKATDTD